MKSKNILQALLLSLAACGLTAVAHADDPAPVPISGSMGLLGQTYAGLSYSYLHLDASPVNADDYGFQYNQALNPGLDGILTYDFTQTGVFAGDRVHQQSVGGALRAFSSAYPWGKPYVEAGVGYTWTKYAGTHDNSLTWELAIGAEFQLAPAFTMNPFLQYTDAPDLPGGGNWIYGVKANYWMNSQWSIAGGISRNDDQDNMFTLGTNFRF